MTELKISHQDRAKHVAGANERSAIRSSAARLGVTSGLGFENARVDPSRRRGRGATANESGRFEPIQRVALDDGWEGLADLPALKTHVTIEKPKSIIARNQSPDISFDRSINPYRGCEHGCIYCYARPSHAHMGHSPGLDFETRLYAKPNAAQLLEAELSKPGYQPRTIALGANTDPYQPVERTYRVTREILEVLERTNHPVGIVTKSALVTRDIDILSRMAKKGLVKVAISITTLDRKLARRMEPRAATPQRRLEALMRLAEAGIPTVVMVAPIIPGLTDMEIEQILSSAKAAGAREAGYVMLRLPLEVRDLFEDWLHQTMPDRARKVMSLVRQIRGGKDNDPEFGKRMKGSGPLAWTIGRRFEMAAERNGLNRAKHALRCDLFEKPLARGDQLALF
jgi:DNA repair photolyase